MLDHHAPFPVAPVPSTGVLLTMGAPVVVPLMPVMQGNCPDGASMDIVLQANGECEGLADQVSEDGETDALACLEVGGNVAQVMWTS